MLGVGSLSQTCYSPRIRRFARRILPLVFAGSGVGCPCCGGTFRRFVMRRGRSDELCPACLSLGRHRLFWLFLEQRLPEQGELTILHFAPEEGIEERLGTWPETRYVTADVDPNSIAAMTFDITAIPFPDRSFDLVICNHVLEHVSDDRAAIRELYRVLKPGAALYSMHPVDTRLARTLEDPAATPDQRLELFWQCDHVRRYGRDFPDRLAEAGFDVSVHRFGRELTQEARAYYRVDADEPIFECRRPAG
jgi:SAM-dependent methyltransferase